METTPLALLSIPLRFEKPVAALNVVPTLERLPPVVRLPVLRFGFVLFPIVLPEIVKVPLVPAELMPLMLPLFDEVVPIASMVCMLLF